jgi:hypothetical protein
MEMSDAIDALHRQDDDVEERGELGKKLDYGCES